MGIKSANDKRAIRGGLLVGQSDALMLLLPKMTRNEFTRLTDRRTILTSRTPNPVRPVRRDVRFSRDRTFGFWILCPWMESCSSGPRCGRQGDARMSAAKFMRRKKSSGKKEEKTREKEEAKKWKKREKTRKERNERNVEGREEREVAPHIGPVITDLYRCFDRISLLACPPSTITSCHTASFRRSKFRYRGLCRDRYDFN